MEFHETLLAAQRNQKQKSSENSYYKARFDPPKKEQRQKDKLSANIQKFLAKKDEEERQKKLEAQRKCEELLAMRDPKALRKIQKSLKVFKSANKSVLADAIDLDNTAVTREGPDQPDQDDYGYESQEAAALYEKMMQKYSKIPDEPKFPVASKAGKKDLNSTIERVKHALQHEDDPVPHRRKRRTDGGKNKLNGEKPSAFPGERDTSPPTKYEPEKKEEKKEKPKIRKPMPPPMDFNQLLKLAEQKKAEPFEVVAKKAQVESKSEPERLMTKRQKREYEEEMARRQRRQERIDAEKGGKKIQRDHRPPERERKPEPAGFGRIPKIGDKANGRHDSPKTHDRERDRERYERDRDRERQDRDRDRERQDRDRDRERQDRDRDRERQDRDRDRERQDRDRDRERQDRDRDRERHERDRAEKIHREKERAREKEASEKDKLERERERIDKERLEKLKAERDRIDREMERLNKEKDKVDKIKSKIESKPVDRSKQVDRSKLSSKEPVRQDAKKSIDLKSQNTYRIDKNSNERKIPIPNKGDNRSMNGHSAQGKPVPKQMSERDRALLAKKFEGSQKVNGQVRPENGKRPPEKAVAKRPDDRRPPQAAGPSKSKMSNSFDFDKHVNGLRNGRPPGDVKRKPRPEAQRGKRRLDSESEYDSEMDDFIDDGDEEMDYSRHIKEIFGYDKSRYRDMDDDDDPNMESSFVQQQREEFISKKHGIMEDLEDMRLEAMMKAKGKKKRRISDD